MYFGSVRFFKHLIITVLMLMIIVPTVLAVVFGIQKNDCEDRLRQTEMENQALKTLNSYYTGEAEPDAAALKDIAVTLGTDLKTLVNMIYCDNKEAFADIIGQWQREQAAPDVSEPADSELTQPDTATDSTDIADVMNESNDEPSPYADIQPELYVTGGNAEFIDDDNCVYLTFDDGPSQYTEKLLEILDRHNIKATFFVIPEDTEECFALMKKIVDSGHTIGVHSYTHKYESIYADVESFLNDFASARELIYQATGVSCKLFRFPGGSKNSYNEGTWQEIVGEMNRRGFVYFDWNVDSEDAVGANWTTMYNNVMNQINGTDRAVILMHDGIYNTTLVLEDIINALLADARDFTFSAITDEVRPLQF